MVSRTPTSRLSCAPPPASHAVTSATHHTSTHHTPAALYTDFTGRTSIDACAAIGGSSLHRCEAAGGARFDAKTDGSEERSPRRTLSPLISCVISSDLPYLPPGTLDGARDAARGHSGQVHRGQGGGDVWNQPRAQAARRSTLITFPPRLNTTNCYLHHHNSSTSSSSTSSSARAIGASSSDWRSRCRTTAPTTASSPSPAHPAWRRAARPRQALSRG